MVMSSIPPSASAAATTCSTRATRVSTSSSDRCGSPGRRDTPGRSSVDRRRRRADGDQLARQEPPAQFIGRLVHHDAAGIDDDDALAHQFDVARVVRGQHDGQALGLRLRVDQVADRRLGGDVEPDGRFVQEQHRGAVQQAGDDLAAHALAERQPVHRLRAATAPGRSARSADRAARQTPLRPGRRCAAAARTSRAPAARPRAASAGRTPRRCGGQAASGRATASGRARSRRRRKVPGCR